MLVVLYKNITVITRRVAFSKSRRSTLAQLICAQNPKEESCALIATVELYATAVVAKRTNTTHLNTRTH
jgi:hypothetical protein